MADAKVRVVLSAVDQASGKIKSAQDEIGSSFVDVGEKARMAGVAMTAMGAVGFMAASQLADSAGQLEEAYAAVSTLMLSTEDNAYMMSDAMREQAITLGTAGDEIDQVAGLYQALSAGVEEGTEAIEFMEVATKTARAGLAETEEVVDAITTTINAMGMEFSEAGDVADNMFTTVERGKTTIPELSAVLGKVLPVANLTSVGFDEVSAAFSTMTRNGLNAARASTALAAAMRTFLKPQDALVDAMVKHNDLAGEQGQIYRDAKAELDSYSSQIEALKNAEFEAGTALYDTNQAIQAQEQEVMRTEMEFNRWRDAISGVRDELDDMSKSTQENRIAIQEIRYAAAKEGRDLTEEEKAQIEELELANQGLRLEMDKKRLEMDKMKDKEEEAESAYDSEKAALEELQAQQNEMVNKELAELQKAYKEQEEVVNALAKTIPGAILEQQGLGETMRLVELATRDETVQMSDLITNIRGMQGALALTGENAEGFNNDLAAMQSNTGDMTEAFNIMADTTASDMNNVESRLESVRTELGESTAPAVVTVKERMADLGEMAVAADKKTGGLLGTLGTLGSAAMATVGPIIALIGQMMMYHGASTMAGGSSIFTTAAMYAQAAAAKVAAGAQWLLNAALTANPIGIVIMAVVALIAILYALEKRYGVVTKAVDALSDALSWLWDKLVAFGKFIKKVVVAYIMIYVNVIKLAIKWIKKLPEIIGKVVDKVGSWLSSMSDKFKNAIGNIIDWFANLGERIWNKIKGLIDKALNWGLDFAEKFIDGILQGIKDLAGNVIDWFANLGERIWNKIKGLIDKALNWGLKFAEKFVSGIVDGIKNLGGNVIEGAKGAFGFNPTMPEMAEETGGVMADLQVGEYEQKIDQLDLEGKMKPDEDMNVPQPRAGREKEAEKRVNVSVEISNPMFIDSSKDREKFIRFFEEELGEVVRDYV